MTMSRVGARNNVITHGAARADGQASPPKRPPLIIVGANRDANLSPQMRQVAQIQRGQQQQGNHTEQVTGLVIMNDTRIDAQSSGLRGGEIVLMADAAPEVVLDPNAGDSFVPEVMERDDNRADFQEWIPSDTLLDALITFADFEKNTQNGDLLKKIKAKVEELHDAGVRNVMWKMPPDALRAPDGPPRKPAASANSGSIVLLPVDHRAVQALASSKRGRQSGWLSHTLQRFLDAVKPEHQTNLQQGEANRIQREEARRKRAALRQGAGQPASGQPLPASVGPHVGANLPHPHRQHTNDLLVLLQEES